MSLIKSIIDRINAIAIMGTKTSDGRPFIEIPMHPDLVRIVDSFPQFLIRTLSIKWLLIFACLIFFNVGVFADSNVLLAFSISLIIFLHLLHYKIWLQACSLTIDAIHYPTEWELGSTLPFTFMVSNGGKSVIEEIEVILIFSDGLESWHHMISLDLSPGAEKKVSLDLKFDHGIGVFSIGPLYYKLSDSLDLYPKIMKINLEKTISIISDTSSPVVPKVEIASIANQVGSIEMSLPGRSTNFYGLRPWRQGDSIRYIDWKRSVRKGDIIVKDFERLTSTDGFIFFDLCHAAHSKYLDFSVFESMKSTVLSLALGLKSLHISTNIISQSIQIRPDIEEEYLIEEIHKIKASQGKILDFPKLLEQNLQFIPPESLAILVFCSDSFNPKDLSESMLWFEDQHIQCITFIFDSKLFAMEIFKKAEFTNLSEDPLRSYYGTIAKKKTNLQAYNISGEIYWVEPKHGFLEHCSDSEKLRVLND